MYVGNDTSELMYVGISWYSSTDGPGVRTVLFLKGCNLRCPWCHSPQTWETSPDLMYFDQLCIRCGTCVDSCPNKVHLITDGIHYLDRLRCALCGHCIDSCPVSTTGSWNKRALAWSGMKKSSSELFQLLKPQLDLLKTVGGLTISGGEPLLQAEALTHLLELCAINNYSIVLETSGAVAISDKELESLAKLIDYWLIGVRPVLPGICKEERIATIDQVTNFLKTLLWDTALTTSSHIRVRYPVIPGFTDSIACLEIISSVMNRFNLSLIEILPLNPHSELYYLALGLDYPLKNVLPPSPSEIEKIMQYFIIRGFNVL